MLNLKSFPDRRKNPEKKVLTYTEVYDKIIKLPGERERGAGKERSRNLRTEAK